MSFFAVLLLLLFNLPTSITALHHIRSELAGTNEPAAGKIPADEQSAGQENNAQMRPKHTAKRAKQDSQTETLTGTVEWEYKPLSWDCDVPNCDHFALYDDASHANYELDDARAALPFEGKRARVTGVVNTKDSVIHVLSIETAK